MNQHLLRFALASALGAPCWAQTLDDLRQQLREDLRQTHFASAFAGMVVLSDELELSGANYRIDDDSGTRLSTFAMPFHRTLSPWGEEAAGLYLEGAIGYARARQGTDDLYSGSFPAIATSVDAEWATYGGLVGAGLEFRPLDNLKLTPILDLSMAWIQNRSDYGGPGAPFTAALADGIAFNWDALAMAYGGAGRVDWVHRLGSEHELQWIGRYDLRWTDTIQQDDSAQGFSSRLQIATLRADVTGPVGAHLFGKPLGWRATASYRRFLEGNLLGVDEYVQLGGALELQTGDALPVGTGLTLSAAAIVGQDLTGWTVGISLMF